MRKDRSAESGPGEGKDKLLGPFLFAPVVRDLGASAIGQAPMSPHGEGAGGHVNPRQACSALGDVVWS